MRTRIYNARILTMEEKRPVFKGEIYIDGGKIFRIKEAKTEKSERTEKPALNEEEPVCMWFLNGNREYVGELKSQA